MVTLKVCVGTGAIGGVGGGGALITGTFNGNGPATTVLANRWRWICWIQ